MNTKIIRERYDSGRGLRVYADYVIKPWLGTPMPLAQRRTLDAIYHDLHKIGITLELPYLVLEKWKHLNDSPNYKKPVDTTPTSV